MAALTVVFDLDGTLVDTAPDLIETPQCRVRARRTAAGRLRRGAQHDRRRRPPDDRERGCSSRAARLPRRRRSTGCSPISSPLRRAHRRPLAALSRPRSGARPAGRARLPLRGLHQQARRAVAAAARRARPDPALRRDLRPGHVRHAKARSRNAAPDHPGGRRRHSARPSWSGIPEPTSPPRAPPAFRWWRSISATAKRRSRELEPDRLISHFDELAAAVLELAPARGLTRRSADVPQKATLSLNLL